jgi:hypothetical protein
MFRKLNFRKECRIFLIVLLLTGILLTTACSGVSGLFATQTPTPTLTYTPTLTPTSTSTPTPTLTPTPTSTPTITPTPTATFTPTPTPTPLGYYSNNQLNFSMTLPPDWEISEKENQVLFTSSSSNIGLLVQSLEGSSQLGLNYLDLMVQVLTDPSFNIFASSTPGAKDQFLLGDGTIADRQVVTGKSPSGKSLMMQVTIAESDDLSYAFIFFGPAAAMKAGDNLIYGIYETIALGDNPLAIVPPTNTDAIAGDWSANTHSVNDPSATLQEDLTILPGCTIGEKCGTISAPALPCSGDIVLSSITGNTYTFTDTNIQPASSCTSGGLEYIRLEHDGTLSWAFYLQSGDLELASTAIMQKK